MENRKKMTPQERAKQFMPFAALKGHREALMQMEKIKVEKMELTEDYKERLDYKLHQIHVQDMVSAVYYHDGEYIRITGLVSRLDSSARVIRIVHTKIAFEDLCDIEIIGGTES